MSCTRHLAGLEWEQHSWTRRVTSTETLTDRATDMWSRAVPVEHVRCRVEYVCEACGAVRSDGFCDCDAERGETCPARLEYLASLVAPPATES